MIATIGIMPIVIARSANQSNVEKEINNFHRQALHAKSLGFIHPTTKERVFFETKRPEDFDRLIKSLNKASI